MSHDSVAQVCPPPPLLPLAYFLLLLPGELLERLLWGVGVSVRGSRCANSSRFIERELALESISFQIIPPALPHLQGPQPVEPEFMRTEFICG